MKKALLALISLIAPTPLLQGQMLQIVDYPGFTISGDAVMASSGNDLGAYQITNQYTEDVKLNFVSIFDCTNAAANQPSFTNIQLFNGNAFVGMAISDGLGLTPGVGCPRGFRYIAYLNPPVVIPRENSITLIARAEVAAYTSGAAQDNSIHRFQMVAANSVGAAGAPSNQPTTNVAFAYGTEIRVLRGDLWFAVAASTSTTSTLQFSANQFGGLVAPNKLTVTFHDEWNTPAFVSPNNISLFLDGGDIVIQGFAIKSATGNTITWIFTQPIIILPGSFINLLLQMPVAMSASIAKATDIAFADGLDPSAAVGLNPLNQGFPIQLNASAPHAK